MSVFDEQIKGSKEPITYRVGKHVVVVCVWPIGYRHPRIGGSDQSANPDQWKHNGKPTTTQGDEAIGWASCQFAYPSSSCEGASVCGQKSSVRSGEQYS